MPADAPPGADPVAIVPLMHRHEVEPSDALTHTRMRHGARPRADASPADRQGRLLRGLVPRRLRDDPRGPGRPAGGRRRPSPPTWPVRTPDQWDVVDLRRLRCADPAGDQLAAALGALEMAERLDPQRRARGRLPGRDAAARASTSRASSRRSARRSATRSGARSGAPRPSARSGSRTRPTRSRDLDAFIDLHQKRWGEDGLFPPTPGGEQSRVFIRRLFELFGPDGPLRLTFLTVGGRCIASGIHFETADELLYYNAGVDPDARDLSPGVLMVYAYVARALADGHAADGLPARQRVVQVRLGRGRRAHPAPARSTKGLT